MTRYACIVLLLLVSGTLASQVKVDAGLKGYVSSVSSSMFEKLSDPLINDNLFHNRLNFKAYSGKFTFTAEARNRLFTGDLVRTVPGFSGSMAADRGFADLSWNIVDEHSLFLNSTIDRLSLDFTAGSFQVTAGRQRINWGQTLVWNPNDIFNAYSYFDFDYIERPGSDAVRLQYFTGASSSLEAAIKADSENRITAAALYRLNFKGFDLQVLGGIFEDDEITAGAGWSGAFGSVSFRGEGSWFMPLQTSAGKSGTVLFTAGIDKLFGEKSTVQLQFMLCNNPVDFTDPGALYTKNMSVKDLAFSKFSGFGSYNYAVTPLLTAAISGMWLPGMDGYFTGLSTDYSAAENIDVSVLWQHFKGVFGNKGSQRLNIAYLRIKFSF